MSQLIEILTTAVNSNSPFFPTTSTCFSPLGLYVSKTLAAYITSAWSESTINVMEHPFQRLCEQGRQKHYRGYVIPSGIFLLRWVECQNDHLISFWKDFCINNFCTKDSQHWYCSRCTGYEICEQLRFWRAQGHLQWQFQAWHHRLRPR